jgi:hypothetical protein
MDRRNFLLAGVAAGASAVTARELIARVPLIESVSALDVDDVAHFEGTTPPNGSWRLSDRLSPTLAEVTVSHEQFIAQQANLFVRGAAGDMHSFEFMPWVTYAQLGGIMLRRGDIIRLGIIAKNRRE